MPQSGPNLSIAQILQESSYWVLSSPTPPLIYYAYYCHFIFLNYYFNNFYKSWKHILKNGSPYCLRIELNSDVRFSDVWYLDPDYQQSYFSLLPTCS